MTDKKISDAAPKASLAATDMIPVACASDDIVYHITGQTLFDSIPQATTSVRGTAEAATLAEVQAAADSARCVTPASLAQAINPLHLAPGWCYIGQVSTPPTFSKINAKFIEAFGRSPARGDLFTMYDSDNDIYILVLNDSAGVFCGINASDGAFVSY